jgi:hypothetical protein
MDSRTADALTGGTSGGTPGVMEEEI